MNTSHTYENFEQLNSHLITCRRCPRLTEYREQVAQTKRKAFQSEDYWGKPVPGFGDSNARLLIVGLAPGAHGSNRTGRMFTGDGSGDFLFPALFRAGFASQPTATSSEDSMQLKDIFISAVCRCVPPGNKPTKAEINNCLPWLELEIAMLPHLEGIIALGRIAYDGINALSEELGISLPRNGFSHGAIYEHENQHPWVLCSYHPSRQNTQTGRLTSEMFNAIWQTAAKKLTQSEPITMTGTPNASHTKED